MKNKKTIKIVNSLVALLTIAAILGPFSFHGLTVARGQTINVTGTVTEPDGITPVQYAYVNVHTTTWSYYSSASTDSNGVFTFTDVPAGNYILEVTAYHWIYKDPPVQTITVPSDGTLDVGIIRLKVANVTGLVTKMDGVTPVNAASINIHKEDWSEYRYTSTNDSGEFGVYLASSGNYVLEVYASDPDEANPQPVNFTFTAGGTKSFTGDDKITLSLPSIKGMVVKPDGITPVAYVSVNIHDQYYSYEKSDWANTDQNGLFRSKALPAGTYYLDINPPSDGSGLIAPNTLTVTVTAGVTNTYYFDNPIQLEQAQKTITGTVEKPDGTKVTNASISTWRMDGGMGWASAQTNSQGQYTMLVGQGNWQASPWPSWIDGVQPDWGYYDMPTSVKFEKANSIAESQTVNFEVTVFDATISGRVLMPNGTPASSADANVNAWSSGGMGGGNWTQLDDNGYFSLEVPSGTFQVEIMPFNNDNYGSPDIGSVTIASGENYNLGSVKLLNKNEFITGRVIDSNNMGVADQSVNAWKASGSWGWGWATTDENGDYTLALTPGVWFVEAMPGGGMSSGGMGGGEENEVTYVKTEAPQKVVLAANETKTNINFNFVIADASIIGTVQNEDGDVLTDLFAWVEAIDVNRSVGVEGDMMGYSGLGGEVQNGKFTVEVPEGTYILSVFMPWGSDYTASTQETVTVGAGETYDGAVVTVLPNNATISGSLLNTDGDQVTGVWGEVFADNGMGGNQWAQFENGTYTLRVSAGEWNLGYWVDPMSGYMPHYSDNEKVTAVADETITYDLTLLELNSTISGTILDPDGDPLKNAWVSADTELGGQHSSDNEAFFYGPMFNQGNISDAEGNFSLQVPEGEYFVTASLPLDQGYINPKAQKVSVDPDNPAEATLQFRVSDGIISGNVILDGENNEAYVWGFSEEGGSAEIYTYDGEYSLNVTKNETWHVGANYQTITTFYRSDDYSVDVPASGTATQDLELVETNIDVPPAETATFDATVAKKMTLTDGTEINMPAYSIASEGMVTVTATPNAQGAATATYRPVALAYDLVAKDEQNQTISSFNSSVTIKLPVDLDLLETLGLTMSDVVPMYYDELTGTWQSVSNVVIGDDYISFTIDHFTSFAIVTNRVKIAEENDLTLTVTNPADNSVVSVNSVLVEGTVSDNEASAIVTLNEGEAQDMTIGNDGSFSQVITGLQIGENTLQVEATKGNDTASATVRVIYKVVNNESGSENEENGGTEETPNTGATGVESGLVTIPQEGGPQVRIFDNQGNLLESFFAYDENLRGEFNVLTVDLDDDGYKEIITYPGEGFGPQVRVFDHRGQFITDFFAYQETFRGGISITAADIDGDGLADLVVQPQSKGGPNIRVFKFNTTTRAFELLDWFMAYQESFRGKLNLITTDIDRNGTDEIILVPAETGGPNVRIYQYNVSTSKIELLDWFMAYQENYRQGVNIGTADVNGDGLKEIITAPAGHGGPNIRVYQYDSDTQKFDILDWFWAYQETYTGGVNFKLADVDNNGIVDIITTPAGKGGPNVRVFHYNSETAGFEVLDWFFAYQEDFRGGVNLNFSDVDKDGNYEIVTSPKNWGGPNVRLYEYNPDTSQFELLDWEMVYDEDFRGKISVKTADLDGNGDSEIIVTPLTKGGPNVRIYDFTDNQLTVSKWFMAYADAFRGGVKVVAGR